MYKFAGTSFPLTFRTLNVRVFQPHSASDFRNNAMFHALVPELRESGRPGCGFHIMPSLQNASEGVFWEPCPHFLLTQYTLR